MSSVHPVSSDRLLEQSYHLRIGERAHPLGQVVDSGSRTKGLGVPYGQLSPCIVRFLNWDRAQGGLNGGSRNHGQTRQVEGECRTL